MKKRVSIITPCFNGDSFLRRFFDSILSQTYQDFELIFVNDGSDDGTENIALEYGRKFNDQGISFIYLSQPNSGQAAALNSGLKVFSGEYLTWPDSDDFLAPRSIQERVNFLENNPQYGFVRTDGFIVPEDDVGKPIGFVSGKKANRFSERIFDDLILERTYFPPVCYMLRTSSFLKVNPKRKIFPSRAGQNWQMLLPVAHSFPCGFVDDPLCFIVARKDSHSRKISGKDEKIKRFGQHEEILREVIKDLDVDQNYYEKLITGKYLRRKLYIAVEYSDKKLAEESYRNLQEMGDVTKRDIINYLMSGNWFLRQLFRSFSRLRRFLLRYIERDDNGEK